MDVVATACEAAVVVGALLLLRPDLLRRLHAAPAMNAAVLGAGVVLAALSIPALALARSQSHDAVSTGIQRGGTVASMSHGMPTHILHLALIAGALLALAVGGLLARRRQGL